MHTVVVIPAEALEAYTHPALDLLTGRIVELEPTQETEQLELDLQEGLASSITPLLHC